MKVDGVHLCSDEVVIDLLPDGPILDIERSQPVLKHREVVALFGHCSGCVIGHSVVDVWFLELAEIVEERDQIVIVAARSSTVGEKGKRECKAGQNDKAYRRISAF